MKSCETGPPVLGSTFSSVILRPCMRVSPAGVELTTSRVTARCTSTEPAVRGPSAILIFYFPKINVIMAVMYVSLQ